MPSNRREGILETYVGHVQLPVHRQDSMKRSLSRVDSILLVDDA